MSVINTNIKSLVSQNALIKNNRSLADAMEQLSTGNRINSAKDDAAGLAISSRMTSQIRGLNQAVRNSNDGISLLQTTEGALIEVTNMIQRMRELAVQSANDTYNSDDRYYLNIEFQELKSEINRIAHMTEWNGRPVLKHSELNSGRFEFQVGTHANQIISIEIPDFTLGQANFSIFQQKSNIEKQVFSLTGNWDSSVVRLNDGIDELSITVPDEQSVGLNDGIVNGSEAANYLATTAYNQSYSEFMNRYNFASTGNSLTISPSASNLNPAPVLLTIDRNGTNAEVNQTVYWKDGTTSLNVMAADLDTYAFTSVTDGEMNVISTSAIIDKESATVSIEVLDEALRRVNTGRANMGATINRLMFASDNLANVSLNTSASRSRILDTDYAKASAELARTQIISQAATAMLAQANQQPQTVLQLLQG